MSTRPDYNSISAPSTANVTLLKSHNVYAYTAWKLGVAYGIAIGLTTISVIYGMTITLLSGRSYSDNFSTVFRAARGASVSVPIPDEDLDGADPLPRYLSKACIWLRKANRNNKIDAAYGPVSPQNSVDAPADASLLWTHNHARSPVQRSNTRVTV